MGELKTQHKKILTLTMIMVAVCCSIATHPILAQIVQRNQRIAAVTAESIDGYQQIIAHYDNGDTHQLTSGPRNHTQPDTDHTAITWVEEWNGIRTVFWYTPEIDTPIPLTFFGQHQHPLVAARLVAWEAWGQNSWQVHFYDGSSVRKLNTTAPAFVLSLDQTEVKYVQKVDDRWEKHVFAIATATDTIIDQDADNKRELSPADSSLPSTAVPTASIVPTYSDTPEPSLSASPTPATDAATLSSPPPSPIASPVDLTPQSSSPSATLTPSAEHAATDSGHTQ